MIRVTYLGHSGFLLEWPGCYWLLDWWKGELPPLDAGKPLLVFVSHRHEDHFNPGIFQIDHPSIRYFLASDIRQTPRNLERWKVRRTAELYTVRRREKQLYQVPGGPLTLEALPSTDEGVAFLLTYQNRTVYHAGDLNWWDWPGEDAAWNRNMAANFKKAAEPLRGRRLDLAFAPLDPRQESSYDWGLTWLLSSARVDRVFPMHFWEDASVIARFRAGHPDLEGEVMEIAAPGQTWEFP